MEWSKEGPTVPGWYWYRNKHVTWIVEVKFEDGELCMDWGQPVHQVYGDWSGPIEAPNERSGQAND